jgi:hypothetical protein
MAQNAKNACSSFHEEYRPKTNEIILFDTSHTLRGDHVREG